MYNLVFLLFKGWVSVEENGEIGILSERCRVLDMMVISDIGG